MEFGLEAGVSWGFLVPCIRNALHLILSAAWACRRQ